MAICNVAILLSTYNGEKFLKEQMDSLIDQREVNVDIYIRDDGSKDNTMKIIEKYCENTNVHYLNDDKNYGPAVSFFELLKAVPETYDFYAFADQDDIWLPNKIKVAIDSIKDDLPMLYCSNQMLYSNGKQTGMRYDRNPGLDVIKVIFGNDIAGCTMVFNRKLRDILLEPDNYPTNEILKLRMHDTWVMLVAGMAGKIVYDNNSYINYRIHSNNTVGLKKQSFMKKIFVFFSEIKTHTDWRSSTAKALLNIKVTENYDDIALIRKIAYYKKRGILSKTKLLFNKEIRSRSNLATFSYFINVILGWI